MNNPRESGRSMVEILGVLCVVGVLIIGGTKGYTWGMNKYRDNKIIDGLQHRMLLAGLGRRSNYSALNQKDQIEESLMGYTVSFDPSFTDQALEVEDAKKITLSGMEQKVCQFIKSDSNLVTMSQESNTMVLINNVQLSKNPVCSDTNGNSLSVIMIPPKDEVASEELTENCSYMGRAYQPGQGVNECGVCQGGTIVSDPTKGTVCQVCNPVTWLLDNVDDGKMKQEDGRCCIKGELTWHNSFCPKPATSCTLGNQSYPNGSDVGTCGICHAGKIEVNSAKFNAACQICDQRTYTIENKFGTCDYNGGSDNGMCAKGNCISCSGWIDALGNCCPDSAECSEECQTTNQCTGGRVCSGGHCTCPTGTFELKNGTCNDCSDLYRREATKSECDKCGAERISVASGGKEFCDWVCPEGWFRNDNRNCTECGHLAAKQTSQEECNKCTGDLARTWDPTTRNCSLGTECPTGYFLIKENKMCRSCSDKTAYPAESANCAKCGDQRMMVGSNCALTGSCPDDYFWVSGTKSCLSCSDTYAAKTDENSCNACGGSRWYGKKDGIGQAGYCEPVCPAGWFQNANGNCTDCANGSGKATTEAQCDLCQTTAFERELRKDGKCYLKNPPTSGYFTDNTGVYRSCSDPESYKPNNTKECSKCGELREMVSGLCVLK